jgi:hypothetical protein
MKDELEHLEHEGWHSLCTGTGSEFYGRVMTTDGMMVLANGQVMTREEVVAALRDAPPWASYEISDLRRVAVGPDATALVYVGTAHREQGPSIVAAMTSSYVRVDGQWRLALYTQTPVPSA